MTDGITDAEDSGKTFHDKQKKLIQLLEENGYKWRFIRSDLFEVEIP